MNEEMLIVPTQEIAFGVKKDGTIIHNQVSKEQLIDCTFKAIDGLIKVINNMGKEDFMPFFLVMGLRYKDVMDTLMRRANAIKDRLKD